MRQLMICTSVAGGVAILLATAALEAQQPIAPKAKAHVDVAKAAGVTHQDANDLYASLCRNGALVAAPQAGGRGGGRGAQDPAEAGAPRSRRVPERSTWYAEPVKVFDNLYWIGEKSVSAWAVTTSAGIILMDALYDYSVEEEVINGLKKLGLDPAQAKYLILSHAHFDHYGGAKYLQDKIPGLRVISSEADWKGIEEQGRGGQVVPKRDMVIADGHKLTLGDTTLTLYVTPGHTPGTISPLVPVRDNGRQHLAAEWGGTGFNGSGTVDYFRTYAASAARFRDMATRAGADVLIGPHPHRDGANRKFPILASRKAGDPHPFVIGKDAVRNALTAIGECAAAQGEQEAAHPTK